MNSEIPKAKDHATIHYDWGKVPDSDLYKNRAQNRMLKKEIKEAAARACVEVEANAVDNEGNDISELIVEKSEVLGERSTPPQATSWKDDIGEYAHRIYIWWLPRWLHTNEFHYFGIVIRKVVLKKMSGANVERDFSKYLVITRPAGTTKIQKQMLHNCVFYMCNKNIMLI